VTWCSVGEHYHSTATGAAHCRPRVVCVCLSTSTTPSDLQERVAELLGRVVVDDGVDARVKVGQAAEEHLRGHVGAAGGVLSDEEVGE